MASNGTTPQMFFYTTFVFLKRRHCGCNAGGLLPLEDIEEVTYDTKTGYFNIKQKAKTTHKFALADS
jgi:hypothetical protein